MTYCLGMLLEEGLIMIADTRTNAGVDNIYSYRKLHCLADDKDQQIYAASAGNLSVTQAVLALVQEGLPPNEEGGKVRTLKDMPSMFRAAMLIGEAMQLTAKRIGEALASTGVARTTTFLFGGRIGQGPPTLFQIYDSGNFIECKTEMPFFQIGETKYGRPILDRIIRPATPLAEAVKIGFLSFDSAMRSNLGVARPLDMVVIRRDPDEPVFTRRIENNDSYFNELSARWSQLLHDATKAIPEPPFMQ
ncbi:MAG TPA: peptidase [Allosphingosinicella sp.]